MALVDVGSAAEAVEADETPMQEMESLCMRCGETGTTRFLLTTIPHFREIVLMAFECAHCNERNNEVQFAGQLQPLGCRFTLKVPKGDSRVLNRQVVKSDSATIKVPELEFEVPPEAQRGVLSTVEGVLLRAAEELQAMQEERWKVDPQTAESLDGFILKLKAFAKGQKDFTFTIDDPAGNSFIENPNAPEIDPLLSAEEYERTPEQQEALGFLADKNESQEAGADEAATKTSHEEKHIYVPAGTRRLPHGSVGAESAHRAIAMGNSQEAAAALFKYSAPEEVMTFPATCGACATGCETRMYVTNIPYFKEVIVMASTCDFCGYKNSELKAGGSVPTKGKKITVRITNKADLCRDIIKSDTASVAIPELELELSPGTLGGLVTTVEGLLMKISEKLKHVHGFQIGDSAEPVSRAKWKDFDHKLTQLVDLEKPWTLVLDDALANSFVAPSTDAFEDDTQMTVEEYERSWEQNEELGLNDIDTGSADITEPRDT